MMIGSSETGADHSEHAQPNNCSCRGEHGWSTSDHINHLCVMPLLHHHYLAQLITSFNSIMAARHLRPDIRLGSSPSVSYQRAANRSLGTIVDNGSATSRGSCPRSLDQSCTPACVTDVHQPVRGTAIVCNPQGHSGQAPTTRHTPRHRATTRQQPREAAAHVLMPSHKTHHTT
jgi:hypothetical protein